MACFLINTAHVDGAYANRAVQNMTSPHCIYTNKMAKRTNYVCSIDKLNLFCLLFCIWM